MSRSRKVLIGVAVMAMLALPVSNVLANHYFDDVPTSAFYHNSVTALANAGITSGCSSTNYCPNSAVTRGQMAVFLDRVANLRNVNGPVVDALTLFGQIFAFGVEQYTLTGGAPRECKPGIDGTGLPFGDYAITYTMMGVPATMTTDEVIVSIVDDGADDPDGTYEICFRRVAGASPNLLAGNYNVYGLAGGFIGSGIFASTGAQSAATTKFLPSWKRR